MNPDVMTEDRQDRHLTETLQQSLRPEPLPRLPDLNLAGRYRPAAEEDAVGGDWYDVIQLSGGKVGIVIGDVVGHGPSAALRMGHLRDAVRAYALEGHGPSAIAERMNQFSLSNRAFGGSTDATMATLVYAQLEADFATLRFVSAGHPRRSCVTRTGRSPSSRGPRPPRWASPRTSATPRSLTFWSPTRCCCSTPTASSKAPRCRSPRVCAGSSRLPERPRLTWRVSATRSWTRSCPAAAKADDDVALLALSPAPVAYDRLALTPSAEPESLAPIRYALGRWLRGSDLNEEEIYEVMVACGEACANAIEHAYSPGDASFDVEAVCGKTGS